MPRPPPGVPGSYRSDDRCAIGLVRTSAERILFVSSPVSGRGGRALVRGVTLVAGPGVA
jgi:hypothetical protein